VTLRVTVRDLETGEEETKEIPAGEYLLTVAEPCYLSHVQTYPMAGTHVLTIKGWRRPEAPKEDAPA
jgi:hypothetical protein